MADDIQHEADGWIRGGRTRGRLEIARGAVGPRHFSAQSSQGNSRSRQIDLAPKEYKKQRGFVADTLRDYVTGGGPKVEGPFTAAITPGETSALEQFRQNAFDPGGVGAAADAQLKATLGDPNSNPFLQAMIDAAQRPLIQSAQLQELRDRANFTGTGQKIQASTAFQENRNNAIRDTEQQVADVATRLAYEERQNQLQAATLANSRLSEQREGIAALALPRMIEQFGIDAGNKELQRRFQAMEQALTVLANLTQPSMSTRSFGWNVAGGGGIGGAGGGDTTVTAGAGSE